MTNGDYMAILQQVLMPVAYEVSEISNTVTDHSAISRSSLHTYIPFYDFSLQILCFAASNRSNAKNVLSRLSCFKSALPNTSRLNQEQCQVRPIDVL